MSNNYLQGKTNMTLEIERIRYKRPVEETRNDDIERLVKDLISDFQTLSKKYSLRPVLIANSLLPLTLEQSVSRESLSSEQNFITWLINRPERGNYCKEIYCEPKSQKDSTIIADFYEAYPLSGWFNVYGDDALRIKRHTKLKEILGETK